MNRSIRYVWSAGAIATLFVLFSHELNAQRYPSQEIFGKNRVQYRLFDWKIYRTSNFEIYFYQNGNNLAKLTAQLAENEFDRISDILGYVPYNRVKIFLYNSPEELAQSNMGIATFKEIQGNDMDLSEARLEIAFTGNQSSFRKKLVDDISRLFVYEMLYGGNLKDALQSSLLLTLPDWYMSGVAAYISEGWSPDLNDYMRDLIQNGNVKRPGLLSGREATVVGQSIWNYIAVRYGRDNISNILNLTRIIRTEQNSITSTLGVPSFGRFLSDWKNFYTDVSKKVTDNYQNPTPDWKYKIGSFNDVDKNNVANVRISPDGKLIAFSELRKGSYRVTVYNPETGKKKVILKGSVWTDVSQRQKPVPLIGWSRTNSLAILTEDNGKQNLFVYDKTDSKKPGLKTKRVIRGLDQIVDMDFSEDGTTLAVSADKAGQNDLFLVSVLRASVIPLTTDIFDDLSPKFVTGSSRKVVFASNRSTDTLSVKGDYKSIGSSFGLYEHPGVPRSPMVSKVVSNFGNLNVPLSASETSVLFLSDSKGVNNVFRLNRADGSILQTTNFSSSVRTAALPSRQNNSLAYLQLEKGNYVLGYQRQFNPSSSFSTPRIDGDRMEPKDKAESPEITAADSVKKEPAAAVSRLNLKPGEVDTDNYTFDEDVLATFANRRRREGFTGSPALVARPRKRENIAVKGPYNYKGLFISNDASSEFRIDPIRDFGYAQQVSMNDLLENHVIKAGGFITPSLTNNDLWGEYNYNAYRIDFGFRYDRRSLNLRDSYSVIQKYRFSQVSVFASYPFSNTARFVVTPIFTSNTFYDVKSSTSGLDKSSHYAGIRAEFVFDNTIGRGLNMKEGTRFKVRFENQAGITHASEGFNRVTLDFRRYQKIHRDIILAARFAFGHSGGNSPKMSVMGGMENWIGLRVNRPENQEDALRLSPNIENRNIFFTEFATNLRGFDINRLSGTTYMLLNAELRIPLVKYLYRGPITSNFLRNLQFTGFTDVGTAWTGQSPFNQENSLNTQIVGVPGAPFRATVTDFRNPYLMGYGFGIRTTLFGIYAKFDYAWGVDNRVVNSPRPYFTLGYDF